MRTSWLLVAATAALGLGGVLAGCSETLDPTSDGSLVEPEPACRPDGGGPDGSPRSEPLTVALVCGHGEDLGTVSVSNDETYLYVTLAPSGGWLLTHSRVGVATSLESFPHMGRQRFGGMVFQRFHNRQPEYTYAIPLRDGWYEGQQQLVLAGNATLCRLEGRRWAPVSIRFAWADGVPHPHPGWHATFEYEVQPVGGAGCVLAVDFPNTAVIFCDGQYAEILWATEGQGCGDEVRIELLRAGEVCQILAENAPNNGLFVWETVAACDGQVEGYTVRVTDLSSGAADESDEPFMISDCPEG